MCGRGIVLPSFAFGFGVVSLRRRAAFVRIWILGRLLALAHLAHCAQFVRLDSETFSRAPLRLAEINSGAMSTNSSFDVFNNFAAFDARASQLARSKALRRRAKFHSRANFH